MAWGAFLGWIVLGSVDNLRIADKHRGPGVVSYEDDDQLVTEAEFRRSHRFYGYFGLGLAGFFWWLSVRRHPKQSRWD